MEIEIDPEFRHCLAMLGRLKKHPYAEAFLERVDTEAFPDYLVAVKDPVDLSLIERHLRAKEYQTPTQFHADVLQMFSNSYRYNPKGSDLYKCTVELEKYYHKLMDRELGQLERDEWDAGNGRDKDGFQRPSDPQVPGRYHSHTSSTPLLVRRKKKPKQPMQTLSEAQISQLQQLLKKVPNTSTAEMLKIITENRVNKSQPIRNIQDVELQSLEPAVLLELDRFVRSRVGSQPRKRQRKRADKPRDKGPTGLSMKVKESSEGEASSDFDPQAQG